jgi:hypothetical protein
MAIFNSYVKLPEGRFKPTLVFGNWGMDIIGYMSGGLSTY